MSPWLALWSFLSLPIHVYCFNDISFRLWLAVRRCRSPVSRVAGAVWPIVSVSDYVVGHLISHKLYCVGLSGTVRLAWPRWANLSPVYRRNELSALTAKVPVEWKCNFQNEWTNQKFYSKNKILLSLKTASSREIHLSSLFPIGFTGRKNKCVGYLSYQITQDQFSGLCDIKVWWKRRKSQTVVRLGCNFVCHVIYLPISPAG